MSVDTIRPAAACECASLSTSVLTRTSLLAEGPVFGASALPSSSFPFSRKARVPKPAVSLKRGLTDLIYGPTCENPILPENTLLQLGPAALHKPVVYTAWRGSSLASLGPHSERTTPALLRTNDVLASGMQPLYTSAAIVRASISNDRLRSLAENTAVMNTACEITTASHSSGSE